eukprot:TRINITY_DN17258_c0_g1_i1.p1 TRINITY_DN17258_c0_g1~~TRINITY_DN17258_c0_g1_i1.p1  ORF type:complete len:979 (-),score=115.99 TRINITY_DN17258_c0_g1_i1:288-3224(-)
MALLASSSWLFAVLLRGANAYAAGSASATASLTSHVMRAFQNSRRPAESGSADATARGVRPLIRRQASHLASARSLVDSSDDTTPGSDSSPSAVAAASQIHASLGGSVWCGEHLAQSCHECTSHHGEEMGADWCNGECQWTFPGMCTPLSVLRPASTAADGGSERQAFDAAAQWPSDSDTPAEPSQVVPAASSSPENVPLSPSQPADKLRQERSLPGVTVEASNSAEQPVTSLSTTHGSRASPSGYTVPPLNSAHGSVPVGVGVQGTLFTPRGSMGTVAQINSAETIGFTAPPGVNPSPIVQGGAAPVSSASPVLFGNQRDQIVQPPAVTVGATDRGNGKTTPGSAITTQPYGAPAPSFSEAALPAESGVPVQDSPTFASSAGLNYVGNAGPGAGPLVVAPVLGFLGGATPGSNASHVSPGYQSSPRVASAAVPSHAGNFPIPGFSGAGSPGSSASHASPGYQSSPTVTSAIGAAGADNVGYARAMPGYATPTPTSPATIAPSVLPRNQAVPPTDASQNQGGWVHGPPVYEPAAQPVPWESITVDARGESTPASRTSSIKLSWNAPSPSIAGTPPPTETRPPSQITSARQSNVTEQGVNVGAVEAGKRGFNAKNVSLVRQLAANGLFGSLGNLSFNRHNYTPPLPRVIIFSLVLEGVDYVRANASGNSRVLNDVLSMVKDSIAAEGGDGVMPELVTVDINGSSKGGVVLSGDIVPPDTVSVDTLRGTLKSSSTLRQTIAATIQTVPDIENISSSVNHIRVSDVSISTGDRSLGRGSGGGAAIKSTATSDTSTSSTTSSSIGLPDTNNSVTASDGNTSVTARDLAGASASSKDENSKNATPTSATAKIVIPELGEHYLLSYAYVLSFVASLFLLVTLGCILKASQSEGAADTSSPETPASNLEASQSEGGVDEAAPEQTATSPEASQPGSGSSQETSQLGGGAGDASQQTPASSPEVSQPGGGAGEITSETPAPSTEVS